MDLQYYAAGIGVYTMQYWCMFLDRFWTCVNHTKSAVHSKNTCKGTKGLMHKVMVLAWLSKSLNTCWTYRAKLIMVLHLTMYNLSTTVVANNKGVPIGGSSTMCDGFRQISLPLATTLVIQTLYCNFTNCLSKQFIWIHQRLHIGKQVVTTRALIPNILNWHCTELYKLSQHEIYLNPPEAAYWKAGCNNEGTNSKYT
jgi:hypothetical protein